MALDDLTTPQAVADELQVSAGEARLPRIIRAASAAIRQFCDREFHYQAGRVELATPRLGTPRLTLKLTPILSVASVVLDGGQVLDPSEYTVEDPDAGFLRRDAGWPWSGLVRAGLLPSEPLAGSERPSITVTYTGGWVTPAQAASDGWSPLLPRTLPDDLEQAAIETAIAMYFRGPQDQSIASESLGSYSVSYRNPNTLIGVGSGGLIPDAAARAIAPYRRVIR